MRGRKLTASWLLLVASLLTAVDAFLPCNSDSICIPEVNGDRCCGGECHPFEYCQAYHPQEWEKKGIYKEHYTLLCDYSYQCERYADAKLYVRENEVVCCDGKCRTEKACDGLAVAGIVFIILGICCCISCIVGIVIGIVYVTNRSNNSTQGTVIGGHQQPPAPYVNYYQPSPPSYTPAVAPVPVDNSYPTKSAPGYPTSNPGFEGDNAYNPSGGGNDVGFTGGTSGGFGSDSAIGGFGGDGGTSAGAGDGGGNT